MRDDACQLKRMSGLSVQRASYRLLSFGVAGFFETGGRGYAERRVPRECAGTTKYQPKPDKPPQSFTYRLAAGLIEGALKVSYLLFLTARLLPLHDLVMSTNMELDLD